MFPPSSLFLGNSSVDGPSPSPFPFIFYNAASASCSIDGETQLFQGGEYTKKPILQKKVFFPLLCLSFRNLFFLPPHKPKLPSAQKRRLRARPDAQSEMGGESHSVFIRPVWLGEATPSFSISFFSPPLSSFSTYGGIALLFVAREGELSSILAAATIAGEICEVEVAGGRLLEPSTLLGKRKTKQAAHTIHVAARALYSAQTRMYTHTYCRIWLGARGKGRR